MPLSRQAMLVLEDIRQFTGDGRYVFPGVSRSRPLSENGVTSALRRMGYSGDQMTAHGFRAMASTLLNELGFRGDVIEAQLAHTGGDKIRAIYNRAEYMKERRRLMQAWADYLDEMDKPGVRQVMNQMQELAGRYDFDVALNAVEQMLTRRSRGEQVSAEYLAGLMSMGLQRPHQPELSCYDQLLPEGVI